jgi:dephospho-CoA kinase
VTKHRQPVIGIVGGIGSGKSTVAKILRDLGCVVSDSDALARAAMEDPAVRASIIKRWGDAVVSANGSIDRSALAGIVFADAQQRKELEGLIHPWIEQRREAQFAAAPADAPALVIDAPLLFEAGLDRVCDAVIFVDTPRSVRLERVRASRGWDEQELNRREDSQMPLDEKRLRADDTVINDGDISDLHEQVRRCLKKIVDTR